MPSAQTDREMMEQQSGEKLFAHIAAQNFDGMVGMLSQSLIGLEYLDENANTPFLFACYLGRFLYVKFLVSRGANIKRINVFGNSIKYLLRQSDVDMARRINEMIFNSSIASNSQVRMHWPWQHFRAIDQLAIFFSVCVRSRHTTTVAFAHHCPWPSSPRTLNSSNISCDLNATVSRRRTNAKVALCTACARWNWPCCRDTSKLLMCCVRCMVVISHISDESRCTIFDKMEEENENVPEQ